MFSFFFAHPIEQKVAKYNYVKIHMTRTTTSARVPLLPPVSLSLKKQFGRYNHQSVSQSSRSCTYDSGIELCYFHSPFTRRVTKNSKRTGSPERAGGIDFPMLDARRFSLSAPIFHRSYVIRELHIACGRFLDLGESDQGGRSNEREREERGRGGG